MKRTLCSALIVFLAWVVVAAFSSLAQAQQIDVAVGYASLDGTASAQATGNHQPQSLNGGGYPMGSGDFLFFKDRTFGIGGEVAYKGNRGNYLSGDLNLPFRPLFWDVNAVWTRRVYKKRIFAELDGGAGSLSTRFYTADARNFATSNHFLLDGGGGLKIYAWRHFFVRPEGRIYLIRNNVEFSSDRAYRFGMSIGYTFKSHQW